MGRGIRKGFIWKLGAALALLTPMLAHADDARRFVKLAAGEETHAWGSIVKASTPSMLLLSLSSEFVTVAVIDGAITQGNQKARSGEALVTPLENGKVRRLQFDARRLAATMPARWLADAKVPLESIAAAQDRKRFWGLLEPVNLNASAPISPAMEAVRSSYLGNSTVTNLRVDAQGNPQTLAALTAKRFAAAMVARDATTVAALIDPKPFTDTGAQAEAWQAARTGFAMKLTADPTLLRAMATEPAAVANDQTAFDAGGYRIRLVPRDRALFVMSVEAL